MNLLAPLLPSRREPISLYRHPLEKLRESNLLPPRLMEHVDRQIRRSDTLVHRSLALVFGAIMATLFLGTYCLTGHPGAIFPLFLIMGISAAFWARRPDTRPIIEIGGRRHRMITLVSDGDWEVTVGVLQALENRHPLLPDFLNAAGELERQSAEMTLIRRRLKEKISFMEPPKVLEEILQTTAQGYRDVNEVLEGFEDLEEAEIRKYTQDRIARLRQEIDRVRRHHQALKEMDACLDSHQRAAVALVRQARDIPSLGPYAEVAEDHRRIIQNTLASLESPRLHALDAIESAEVDPV